MQLKNRLYPSARALAVLLMMGGTWLSTATAHDSAHSAHSAAPLPALPGTSIYQVNAGMTDHNGREFQLPSLRGKPVLVSMFYNSCTFVCPMLIDTMQLTQQELTGSERARLAVLLITFDPARDDVKALKSVLDKRELDTKQWTLARTSEPSVRKIAATLGIQYRLLPDGEYNHTTVLVLLDGQGRIVGRTQKIGAVDPAFIKLVKQTLLAGKAAGS